MPDLEELFKGREGELASIAEAASNGERAKVADGIASLVVGVATGNPLLGALAPLARQGIARALGNSADDMFRRELALMEKEEERQEFIGRIDSVVAALVGQALIQLVRNQHAVKDEILTALGGVRSDLEVFRNDFARRLGDDQGAIRVDAEQLAEVHLRAETTEAVKSKFALVAKTQLKQLLRYLDDTRKPFEVQNRRLRELVEKMTRRLGIEEQHEFELFFARFYAEMNALEKFEFAQLRATTDGILYPNNSSALEMLEQNPDWVDLIPALDALRQHLVFWCNKYDRVFRVTPEMCVVYVGVEDRVPFPRGIEQTIRNWIESQA